MAEQGALLPGESPQTLYFHRFQFYDNPQRSTPDIIFGRLKFRGYYDFHFCPNAAQKGVDGMKITFGVHLCQSDMLQLPRPIRCIIMLVDISGNNDKDLLIRDHTCNTIDDWGKGANNTVEWKQIKQMGFKNVQLGKRGVSSRSFLCKYQFIWC